MEGISSWIHYTQVKAAPESDDHKIGELKLIDKKKSLTDCTWEIGLAYVEAGAPIINWFSVFKPMQFNKRNNSEI